MASDTRPGVGPESPQDARWVLVRRIAASPHLKNSPRLCEFLFYVTGCAVRNAPDDATEQQIGVNVFGRSPGYNSSEDSIVRTHARLLRQKLADYFEERGSTEELGLEIPKGHYLPVFRARLAAKSEMESPPHPATAVAADSSDEHTQPARNHRSLWILAGCAFLLLCLTGGAVWHARRSPAQSPVDAFWQPFLTGAPPLVIYSNALFVGDSTHGLRYAPPGAAIPHDKEGYVDTYTGVGELLSVHALTHLFDQRHASFILKRSLLVTWDEAKARNLIFIGAPVENPALRVLPPTTDFTMVSAIGYSGIANLHPLPGEPTLFSRPEHPLTKDYAIVALLPGVTPGHRVLIFSGLMTLGTQAAVEFVCEPDSVAALLKKVRGPKGEIRPFEAVLETNIGGGVPLQTHLVTVRIH